MHPVNPRIKEVFEKLRPVLGERIDRLWRVYVCDPYSRRDIESLVLAYADRHLGENYQSKKTLLEPMPRVDAQGDYSMGQICYDKPLYPFCLRKPELSGHISVFGKSQSGKTNFGRLLIRHLLEDGTPFLCFDFKGNYSHFADHEHAHKLKLLSAGGTPNPLQFNPLISPEGVRADTYLRELVTILLGSYFPHLRLLTVEGVEYLLLKALEGFDGVPTFKKLSKSIADYKGTGEERRWKVSAQNLLFKLTHGPIGSVLETSCDHIGELLDAQAILNMEALGGSKEKSFLTQAVMNWIFHKRLTQGRSDLRHVIILEEAHHVFRAAGQSGVIERIIRQISEYGEGIVFMDQHPSLTPPECIGNTFATVCFNLKAKQDLDVIAPALQLKSDQRHYLSSLSPGEAIVKLQDRHTRPFMVQTDEFADGKLLGNEQEKAKNQAGNSPKAKNPPSHAIKKQLMPCQPPAKRKRGKLLGGRERMERQFLEDIARYPSSALTQRYRRLRLNNFQGPRLKARLEAKGLIHAEDVSVLGRRISALELTHEGRELLGELAEPDLSKGRGGFFHEFWKHWLASWLRAIGWAVLIEHPIGGGKTVDLVAIKGKRELAIEVETGKSDPIGNIKKCIDAGFREVLSVHLSEESRQATLKSLTHSIKKGKVLTLTEFTAQMAEGAAVHDAE